MSELPARDRAVNMARWVLVVSYGLGAPAVAMLEVTRHVLSHRFGYPPALVYVTCAVQFLCAVALLLRRFVPQAAGILTVTTLGAAYSHVRIGSPMTAIPALLYTALQVWVGVGSRRPDRRTA